MKTLAAALLTCVGVGASVGPDPVPAPRHALAPAASAAPPFAAIVLPAALRDTMSAIWTRNNRHWDELRDQNTLTQLLGTGKPTQHEYLGCLVGEVVNDTLFVRRLASARHLRQLQFAVTGSCAAVDGAVGTWHTHPYRADSAGRALKERGLSALDLQTFATASDIVAIVMWDVDSLDVAAKRPDGTLHHPASLAVR